jgi:MazG family protein
VYFCNTNSIEMHTREENLQAFGRLLDVLDELRQKCPWDRKQTFGSLRPNTIEEVYELCDATMQKNWQDACKELGDVMEHVIFYAILGREQGDFDIADVCNKEADKLIFRHPHIYGDQKADTEKEVLESWEQIKLKEKDGNKTVLSGVPQALPSLIKAYRIQDKVRNVGFDWKHRDDVWAKVREELDELEAELKREDRERSTEELGDFIFSVVNAARLYKLNPDTALEKTNQKFMRRFGYVEEQARSQGRNLKDMTLEEMDSLWNEAKQQERETAG